MMQLIAYRALKSLCYVNKFYQKDYKPLFNNFNHFKICFLEVVQCFLVSMIIHFQNMQFQYFYIYFLFGRKQYLQTNGHDHRQYQFLLFSFIFKYILNDFSTEAAYSHYLLILKMQSSVPEVVNDKKNIALQFAYLKVQLPSVFNIKDDAELQIIGFRFDPSRRLTSTKEIETIKKENVGSLINRIRDEVKASLNLYEEKNWKNVQRDLSPFTFQLEITVRVVKVNVPSIEIRPLIGSNSQLFHLLEINFQVDTDATLKQTINQTSQRVLSQFRNHIFQAQKWSVSLSPQKLFNPHIFIKTQSKDKYIEYYAKGIYEYYHYSDQSFNDHGWGCAYRSLQSLLSWLSLQNHLRLPKMLTITQIQQLIDRINLGSKDKLRNTKEWIGATEVSWVVKHLTNFDCRILHISDGKRIIQECQMFREHFEKVGSPIMYGGGQYAYSIVGINYSWKLGECEFLILDPHYTGPDSMDKIIQKKGLCWRKPEQMFKKGVFYNFCLPII